MQSRGSPWLGSHGKLGPGDVEGGRIQTRRHSQKDQVGEACSEDARDMQGPPREQREIRLKGQGNTRLPRALNDR